MADTQRDNASYYGSQAEHFAPDSTKTFAYQPEKHFLELPSAYYFTYKAYLRPGKCDIVVYMNCVEA